MKRIVKKYCYQISFELASPLAVSSGRNDKTDKDIIRNSAGIPYIPASSVAGVIRNAMGDDSRVDKYFGFVKTVSQDNRIADAGDSKIVFYDAVLKSGYHTSVRDSVALDQYKTAIDGAKFDMEVLEAGVPFQTLLEQNCYEGDTENVALEAAKLFLTERIVFGGKSMRGYGSIKNVKVRERSFDLTDPDETKAWLKFDPYDEDCWKSGRPVEADSGDTPRKLDIQLNLRGGISVRRYTTDVKVKDSDSQPDMEQLTSHFGSGRNTRPVIPGTTWAGAFRHRMEEFGCNPLIFGYVKGNGEKSRSLIRFGESFIENGHDMTLSRNAIDRFTGGTKDGALFTEKTSYGGRTALEISWAGDKPMEEGDIRALAAALTDLHYGFLAVGGETSVGRGLFSITGINGTALDENDVYSFVLGKVREVMA